MSVFWIHEKWAISGEVPNFRPFSPLKTLQALQARDRSQDKSFGYKKPRLKSGVFFC